MKTTTLSSQLLRWYLNRGMTDRLADAVLVCRYIETMLDGIPATQTGRLAPVFDHSMHTLRDDWRKVAFPNLWLDGVTGEIVDALPPADGDIDTQHEHLPHSIQADILFGRFAHLFR